MVRKDKVSVSGLVTSGGVLGSLRVKIKLIRAGAGSRVPRNWEKNVVLYAQTPLKTANPPSRAGESGFASSFSTSGSGPGRVCRQVTP